MARYALRKRVLSTDYPHFSKTETLECGGLAPLWPRSREIGIKRRQAAALQGGHETACLVPSQRRIESAMMTAAANMMIAVRLVLIRPRNLVSGFCVSGQKMSVIDLNPATSVVVLTNASGRIVTQA